MPLRFRITILAVANAIAAVGMMACTMARNMNSTVFLAKPPVMNIGDKSETDFERARHEIIIKIP